MLSFPILVLSNHNPSSPCRLVINVDETTFDIMSGNDFAIAIEAAHKKHRCKCYQHAALVIPLCMGLLAMKFEPLLRPRSHFSHSTLRLRALNTEGLKELRGLATMRPDPEQPPPTFYAVFATATLAPSRTGPSQQERYRIDQGAIMLRQGFGNPSRDGSGDGGVVFRQVAKPLDVVTRILATYAENATVPNKQAVFPPPPKTRLIMPPSNIYNAFTEPDTLIVDDTALIPSKILKELFGQSDHAAFVRVMCVSDHQSEWLASVLASALDCTNIGHADETILRLSAFERSASELPNSFSYLLLKFDLSKFGKPRQWSHMEIRRWLYTQVGESLLAFLEKNSEALSRGTVGWMQRILCKHPFEWLPSIIVRRIDPKPCLRRRLQRVADFKPPQELMGALKLRLAVWVHGLDAILVDPLATASLYRNDGTLRTLKFTTGLIHALIFCHLAEHAGKGAFQKGIFSAGVHGRWLLWEEAGLSTMSKDVEILDLMSLDRPGPERIRGISATAIRDIGKVLQEPRFIYWCEFGLVDVSGCAMNEDLRLPLPATGKKSVKKGSRHEVYDPAICSIAWTVSRKNPESTVEKVRQLALDEVTSAWEAKFAAVASSCLLRARLFDARALLNGDGWAAVGDHYPAHGATSHAEASLETFCKHTPTAECTALEMLVWRGALIPVTSSTRARYATAGRAIVTVLIRIYALQESANHTITNAPRSQLTETQAKKLLGPLCKRVRKWFDDLPQEAYNGFAPPPESHMPPSNEEALQVWLVEATMNPERGLRAALRDVILKISKVDFDPLFITCMVEVSLRNGDSNIRMDYNVHIDLCPECKLNIGAEIKYVLCFWKYTLGNDGSTSSKYSLCAVPMLSKHHRDQFLPPATTESKWSMANPSAKQYTSRVEDGKNFPNPLTELGQLGFSRHPKQVSKVLTAEWETFRLGEEEVRSLGEIQMNDQRGAFGGGLQPLVERAATGIRDMRYRVNEYTNSKCYHLSHLLVFLAGGALLYRLNGTYIEHVGPELIVCDPYTPTRVKKHNEEITKNAGMEMVSTTWTVYTVPARPNSL